VVSKEMNKKKEILLLIALIFLLIFVNYNFLDNKLKEFVKDSDVRTVERIIDGDTIVVENNTHIRLLGINTGILYFSETAKGN
jgi:endonuclease YncB( thermonuclease family)